MATLFYFGSNLSRNLIDLIKLHKDAFLLLDDDNFLSSSWNHSSLGKFDASLLQELITDKKAFYLESKNVVPCSIRRANPITYDEELIEEVVSDFRLFLLHSRYDRINYWGNFKAFNEFVDFIYMCAEFLSKANLDLVYFGYTPHTLKGWIFARVCDALQIKIVRVIPSPLPWSYYVVEGIGNVKTNIILPAAKCAIKDRLTKYVEILNSDYTLAKPYYERHRKIVFSNFTSAFVSFITQPIASTVALVKQSFKSIEKRRIYAEYKKFERCNDLPESYGVYFLHYQPESNTCPEAELFVDQFIAIKKVSEALPDGYRLLVREHPSTFSKRADGRWRPKCFYRRISELPLVDICDLDKSPFELMDSAAFVVSIAGIVLTEAIARRTPIVHFSPPRFSAVSRPYIIDGTATDAASLKTQLSSIASQDVIICDREAFKCLWELYVVAFDGAADESFVHKDRGDALTGCLGAHWIAVNDILSNKNY